MGRDAVSPLCAANNLDLFETLARGAFSASSDAVPKRRRTTPTREPQFGAGGLPSSASNLFVLLTQPITSVCGSEGGDARG
jgi:hypothetical protein